MSSGESMFSVETERTLNNSSLTQEFVMAARYDGVAWSKGGMRQQLQTMTGRVGQ